MTDSGLTQNQTTEMRCDNQSTVVMAKKPVFHGRTKHIKIKYHFIRETEVELVHCSSKDQFANILTKALPKTKFEGLRKTLGVSIKK